MQRIAVILFIALFISGISRAETEILGEPVVDADALAQFVSKRNPDFDPEIARAFIEVGKRYGVRGDIALCQAILETGWFRFADGTAVDSCQYNFCGLGVTRNGVKGASFESVEQGVTAMIQHLYAYCSTCSLPCDDEVIDPRFGLVTRGSATTWEALSNRWAANPEYGTTILRIYETLIAGTNIKPAATEIPEISDSGAADMSHTEIFH